ncbi:MAG TPA: sodium:solute symporter family protein [Ignavibacteriaceae bacterium]|jgi:SSS family solute:Na+ symporter|nr:MAG: Sodium/glucose cotransporter [Ignavibacteria bacterium ADurb.Bin266]OQY73285.1 MAG: sodium:proline symporter [Ignavibacteriales bacterium UTCHB2]HQF42438.1 sodium:solute symporter family protein [Ignavibacteriaceae bacterium]HQI40173.1 sodium:solute symporter family protein [Ignavibacteriaceae bacterium]
MNAHHSLGTSTDWIVMVVYFIAIMLFGSYFSKYNRTTTDFFFGGRRFKWWLIAMSIVATGVGSHSFIKYSAKGFEAGFSSTMTYMNDWFFVPFFIFGWLPIIIYTKIRSIPEYFEKRFSPSTRFLATLLLLLYMIGYVGIGFLTMGKAILPLLPPEFTILGMHFNITLMGLVIVIALIVGIYITYGGQTAVIFTDLLQGFILIFAGMLVFFLGLDYIGGFGLFWNALPTSWKLPLANFNNPPGFNFVGIFWQDGIAGSVGFLFMNMGLIMRFMATKSVDEGRKAATFNILFMLPISAIVVGNAGWIGKAISVMHPDVIPPDTNPDNIFVVVANIISLPGVFGFVMAALTAALMSTVDTLLNATAAIYINDVHRPAKKWLSKKIRSLKEEDKQELNAARIATVIFTVMGVLAVIPFESFPTVYEAHGYFHSTLTPPLVVGIFLGVFWKKFTNAAVIATFVVGVALMILGMYYPRPLIEVFAHGTDYDPQHPYTYIGALYNLFVCVLVGVLTTVTRKQQKKLIDWIKTTPNHKSLMSGLTFVSGGLFVIILFNLASLPVLLLLSAIMLVLVVLSSNYYSKYSEKTHTEGLTVWGIAKAKEMFKGRKVNDRDGEIIKVNWKIKESDTDLMYFSKNDMAKMAADPGDLVYLCDARRYLGGLKSVHSTYGEPHDEDGIVYITQEHIDQGQFVKDKVLTAEKEM